MKSGGKNHNGKMSRLSAHGASMLNKLSAEARRRSKRVADKARRQCEKLQLRSELLD